MITLKPKYRKLKTYSDLGVYILLLILSLVLLGTVTSCQKNKLSLTNAGDTIVTTDDINFVDRKQGIIVYHILPDRGSICMVGNHLHQ